jgi:regulator of sigma E protease
LRWVLLRHALDKRAVVLRVRTLEDVDAFRRLDLSAVAIDDGNTDLIARIGLAPWRPQVDPIIGRIAAGSAAERAGMQSGDRVTAIAGMPIESWAELVSRVREAPGRALVFELERGGRTLAVDVTPEVVEQDGARIGRIGVGVAEPAPGGLAMFGEVRYGVVEGLSRAVSQTWETSVLSLKMIGRMLTGEVSWRNLSGPVTIADYAGQTAQLGWTHYLKFIALISISLGVLNLLPIPVLDGGHLLYYTVEIIKGGPIPERIMEIGQQIGLALLVMLMAFAFYNDINRLISG